MLRYRGERLQRVDWLVVGVLLVVASTAGRVHAKPDYLGQFRGEYPATDGSRIDACALCHTAIPQLNSYGSAYSDASRDFASIEGLDSDGDGVPNLAEIGALTFPGDPADFPALPSPTATATLPLTLPTATPTATLPLALPTATPTATLPLALPTATPTATLPLALATATPTATLPGATPTATQGSGDCAGDCNANGVVTVDELLRAVNIALEKADVALCVPVDRDGNGKVSINELLLAVNSALRGCS